MSEEQYPSIDIVLDEARRKLDFQFQQLDGLDTKSGTLLGINGVLMALLITGVIEYSHQPNIILVKLALAPIFISFILSLISIITRNWDNPPKLKYLRSKYIDKNAVETKLSIIDIFIEAVENNTGRIQFKISLWRLSYVTLALGVILFSIWALLIVI